MNKARRFLKALTILFKPRTWGVFTETYEATNFDAAFSISFSQGAEDLALFFTVMADPEINAKAEKRYLDIGAHDPNRFSVTRRLYDLGWNGVNVDANLALEAKFKKWRKRDIFITAAIGDKTEYEFYAFNETAISTINPEWRDGAVNAGNLISRSEVVKGRTLRSILDQYFPNGLDFLNIDIEGADEEALSSINFPTLPKEKYPRWLLLETSPPVKHSLDFPAVVLALQYGYTPWLVLPMGTLLKQTGN